MKKILSILTLTLLTTACQGPMGPQGPQGPQGEGVNWKVYDFTIPSSAWELVNGENQFDSYYIYTLSGKDAPIELQYVVDNLGDASGYYVSRLNGEDLFAPLPYESYYGTTNEYGEEILWSETYKFDFTRSTLSFLVYYSDFMTDIRPGEATFRISLKW